MKDYNIVGNVLYSPNIYILSWCLEALDDDFFCGEGVYFNT